MKNTKDNYIDVIMDRLFDDITSKYVYYKGTLINSMVLDFESGIIILILEDHRELTFSKHDIIDLIEHDHFELSEELSED